MVPITFFYREFLIWKQPYPITDWLYSKQFRSLPKYNLHPEQAKTHWRY